ncbi:MAG: efflux transporter outer membrane subunit [Desulfarculaceae bacterium]|jgi:multidrug efflux system outer membrane protein
MKKALLILLCLGLITSLNGCLRLGPDYSPPGAPSPPPAQFQHAPAALTAYQAQDRWWETFGDPELNQLVQAALVHNWDLKKAAARVMELQSLFRQAGALRYPQLDLEAKGGRQQSVQTTLSSLRGTDRRTDSFNLNVAASFEVDLWGRLVRAEEAAWADLLGAEENQRTVVQTLVAGVVVSYLKIEALERRLEVARRSQEAFAQSLDLVTSRYNRGLVSILDLRQARRTLAQAEAVTPPLRQELGLEQHKLATLVGSYPKTKPARVQPEDYFLNLEPVPPGLPSELLLRRPDLRAAEAKLKALTARVGVAKAARFPTIRLTGALGYSSSELDQLFEPGANIWSFGGGLLQPLFDAGLLEAQQRAAEARLKQGLAEYAQAALDAFAEVEGALLTRKEQLLRRQLVQQTLTEAIATQEAANSRYQRGLTDYLSVLDAQKTRYQVEDTLVLTELAILSNRVALHRALGGGWDLSALEKGQTENKP